ncbi:hypothetical protein B7494_g2239 [Chlorociboria aeruginascens]|nr:hypothetical protein B7494_g2239 [Chlorociboria aeruginascens]
MDSGNWRVKREPDATSGSQNQQARLSSTNHRDTSRSNRSQGYGKNDHQPSSFRKPLLDTKAEQAIVEGRRLYVGNLPYEATTKDIERMFADVSSAIQAINMSVDPMTGRNPSYCFIDFSSREAAAQVMEEYNGKDFLQRPLKIKPGIAARVPRQEITNHSPSNPNSPYAFDRWRRDDNLEKLNVAAKDGRRLYVGGLPKPKDQFTTNADMRELFEGEGFNVQAVSKMISPHESKQFQGNHNYYCFVDLSTKEEANAAIAALDGLEKWNCKIKVDRATGTSGKLGERRRLFVGGIPDLEEQAAEREIRDLFSDFEIKTISKLFSPKESLKGEPGNSRFCFVELADEQQTDNAIASLDWLDKWDGKVRVKPALGDSKPPHRPTPWSRGQGSS